MFWKSKHDWGLIGYIRTHVIWYWDGDATGEETFCMWKLFVCSKTAKRKYEFKATGHIQYHDYHKKRPDYGNKYPQIQAKIEHWLTGAPVDFGGEYVPNTVDLKCVWTGERYDFGKKDADEVLTPPED